MAQITLNSGESFTVSGGNNIITGRPGSGETVTVTGGTQNFDADFNAGGDRIILSGNAAQYQVSRSGSTITLTGPNSTVITFPAPNPSLTAAQQPVIQFADTSLALSSTTTGGFNVLLGTQTVNATPTNVGGGTGGGGGGANVLNVTVGDVNEGQAITYTFTLATAPTAPVTINVATVGGTATTGTDYTPVATAITFAVGQTTQFLTVNTIADLVAEAAETVSLQVTLPTGVTLAAGADITAQINADAPPPTAFTLTTDNDTFTGGAGADRFVGSQDVTKPGKLLSANDVLNGGDGVDALELTNAPGGVANVLADIDFTNVTSTERLVTNYNNVQLGAQADKAGIVSIDTASRTDAANVAGNVFGGTLLDLTSDANNDTVPDFNNVLTVTMANSTADTVRLALASAAGSSINTGTTFTPIGGGAAFGQLDSVVLSAQTNPIRITFVSAGAGNGSAFGADGTTLALTAQSEDASDGLTGGIVTFDDEGINFTGNLFDVRGSNVGAPDTPRGTFAQVILGTQLNETLNGTNTILSGGVLLGAYINAGAGVDTLNGTGGNDFLVGGGGNDTLNGGQGVDSILGGAGNDVVNGGGGVDALLDGGEGNDTYVFADGEFVANESITDSGVTVGDIDYLAITSATALGDAQFAGRTGIEGLATNVTSSAIGGATEVTLGANAQAIGVRTVYAGNDDVDAGAYTADLTVYGQGGVTTGGGNDIVVLQNQTAQQTTLNNLGQVTSSAGTQSYQGAVVLGAGNDTLIAGYALFGGNNNVLTGGLGTDTLVLGGTTASQGGVLPTNTNFTASGFGAFAQPFGSNFTGFEAITINAATAGSAVSYTFNFVDANVDAGTTLVVNGSTLRSGVVLAGPDFVAGTADDVTTNEVLTVNASALTGTRAVSVTGGASADVLTGGAGADTLIGGAGEDTLTGGAGADVLTGGTGNDLLIGGAGSDTLNGGDGGDDYRFANGELIATDVIADDGAAGADAITVASATALTDALFANKTGLEVLNSSVAGASNDATAEVVIAAAAQASGITTVNSGDDDVDASGYTIDVTVNSGTQFTGGASTTFTTLGNVTTGSGSDIVNLTGTFLASANLTVGLGAGNDTLNSFITLIGGGAAGATLTGGAGLDVLTLNGLLRPAYGSGVTGFVANYAYNFGANANFTGFEQITVLGSDAPVAVAGPDQAGNALSATITLADANIAVGTTFTVDASTLTSVVTSYGTDGEPGGTGVNADVSTQQTLTLQAGALSGARNIAALGGAGDDVITTGAGADTLTGGAGVDTLNGGAGADTLDGGDGNDFLTGGAGFDTIRGGAGNDTIALSVTEFNSDADNVDGGAGNDVLQITGTAAAQEIADVGFNGRFVSIEEVRIVGGPGAANTAFTYNAGFYSQTAGVNLISLGANASGSTVSIASYTQGGPGNFPVPAVTLNDILVTTNNAIFVGSNFADTFNLGGINATGTTLTGGGNDVVRAGLGDDVINFGGGLSSGAGGDIVDGGGGANDVLNVGVGGGAYTGQTVNLTATLVGGAVTAGIYAVDRVVLAAGRAPTATTGGTSNTYTVTVDDSTFDSTTGSVTIDGSALRGTFSNAGPDATLGTADDIVNTNTEGLTVTSTASAAYSIVALGGGSNDSLTGGAGNDTLTGNDGADTLNGGGGNDALTGGAGNDTISGGAGNDTIDGGTGSDTISGDAGVDAINLGADAVRDIVNVLVTGDAPRAAQAGIETVTNFGFDGDNVAGLNATADVIDFGSGIITTTSTSITNGVVQAGTVLANAINSSTSLLAAIQLVEQEFQGGADPLANNGVVAFTYGGNTYIGEIAGGQGLEAFVDIVQLTGVSTGFTALIDADGVGAGTQLGLGIFV